MVVNLLVESSIYYLLSIIYYLLSIIYYLLSIIYYEILIQHLKYIYYFQPYSIKPRPGIINYFRTWFYQHFLILQNITHDQSSYPSSVSVAVIAIIHDISLVCRSVRYAFLLQQYRPDPSPQFYPHIVWTIIYAQ